MGDIPDFKFFLLAAVSVVIFFYLIFEGTIEVRYEGKILNAPKMEDTLLDEEIL